MARKAMVLVALLASVAALSGCISSETHYSYDHPDDSCWMFCGSESYEYNAFIWFPMAFVLLIVVAVVIAIVASQSSQQTVIIREKEKE